jgi:hypothetical protein
VIDSTGATVSGARVAIRNISTGITAARETGQNGAYLFDNVEPGMYIVSAEMPGFARQQQENLLVQTRADVTVNFTLKPGGLVETVNVTASAVELQFNTTTRELTVDRKMLMNLPVKGETRSPWRYWIRR